MSDYEPQDALNVLRDIHRHRDYLRAALHTIISRLEERAIVHDLSKLRDDEFPGYARLNAAARTLQFGTTEYKEAIQRERETVNLHFAHNSHHPEYGNPNFLDIIEMVCDWYAAWCGYGTDKRPWRDSVEQSFEMKSKYLNEAQLWLARQVALLLEER